MEILSRNLLLICSKPRECKQVRGEKKYLLPLLGELLSFQVKSELIMQPQVLKCCSLANVLSEDFFEK